MNRRKHLIRSIRVHFLVILALIPVLFPIYWLAVSALQSPASIVSIPPKIFPGDFSLYFIKKVFSEFGIAR